MPYQDLKNIYCWQRSTGFISKRCNLIGCLLSIYSVMNNGKVSLLTVCTGGEFEPCLGGVGWGIWTWTVKSFQQNTCALSFNMEVFKAKEFTFTSRWLRRKELQESHGHWPCFVQKIDHQIQQLGWAFECNSGPWGQELKWTNLRKFKCVGGCHIFFIL